MRRKKGWMNLKVVDIVHETHDTDTFYLVNEDEGERAFDYIAGQYLTFRFDNVGEKPLVRSYTMSSSPRDMGPAAFTVKRVETGVISNWLCDEVKVGSILRARGPIGKFCWFTTDQPHLFMTAGGSGVTPFISIMRDHAPTLGQEGSPQKMTLLVSYRSKKDLILWETIHELNQIEGINIITTLSREDATGEGFWHGRIDGDMIQKAADHQWHEMTVMSCGPEAMMDLTIKLAKEAGVADEQAKLESFFS
jgi:ring-1,2-phenylacetyl-CoA epoxidase subunit PaaE